MIVVGGGEEDYRWQTDGSGDKSCCCGRGGRRSGNGKVDDGADEARGGDEGSWSSAVDERRPSLAVDDGVGVAAPARWRMGWRTEEAGRSAEVVVPPMVYEWGNRGEGGSQTLGHASLKWGKVTNLSPV